ncbi:MAG: hypothetical protein AAGA70_07895 [Pseudomonadota bacterium]
MKFLVFVNLFLPGVGTFLSGKVVTGVLQQGLFWLGVFGANTGILALPGWLAILVAWLWALSNVAVFWETDDEGS